jgi:5-formyltetrahydrofolate cyclo-ligase
MLTEACDNNVIRKHMRQCRNALSSNQQAEHAQLVCAHYLDAFASSSIVHLGLSLSFDGEVSLLPLAEVLWLQGVYCYLPVIQADQSLMFAPWYADTRFKKNRFNIPEPIVEVSVDASVLDAVLLPLVAVDHRGNRLGMGGGYYDRTFANVRTRPTLIGVAHHCQFIEELQTEPWDVPLDALITEQGVRYWQSVTGEKHVAI